MGMAQTPSRFQAEVSKYLWPPKIIQQVVILGHPASPIKL
jgi:hypothetical protein